MGLPVSVGGLFSGSCSRFLGNIEPENGPIEKFFFDFLLFSGSTFGFGGCRKTCL